MISVAELEILPIEQSEMSERPHPITVVLGSLVLAVATLWVVWADSLITPNWRRVQHELWIFYIKAGDGYLANGKISEALEVQRAGLVVAERLAAAELEEKDAAISHMKIGEVLIAQGSSELALNAFQEGLAMAERLSSTEPGDAGWHGEMMLSYEKVGDLLENESNSGAALEAYRSAVSLARRLAAAEPSNARWQNYLSRLHLKIGNALADQGSLDQALTAYHDSIAIAERNMGGWQRDLWLSRVQLGDVLLALGEVDAAIRAYRESLPIAAVALNENQHPQRRAQRAHWPVLAQAMLQPVLSQALRLIPSAFVAAEWSTALARVVPRAQEATPASLIRVADTLPQAETR